MPFSAATAAYLLASTLVVGTAHPLRSAAALWVLVGISAGLAGFWEIGWMTRGFDVINWFIGGDPFTRGVQLPTGGREGWMLLPTMGMWAASSALSIGLGLVGMLGAAARPRDH